MGRKILSLFLTLRQHDCKIFTVTILLTRHLPSCNIRPPPELAWEGHSGSPADVIVFEALILPEQLHASAKDI